MHYQRRHKQGAIHPRIPGQLSIVRATVTNTAEPYGTFVSVTAVGGTTDVPETAIFFSGGGFSNFVSCIDACATRISAHRDV